MTNHRILLSARVSNVLAVLCCFSLLGGGCSEPARSIRVREASSVVSPSRDQVQCDRPPTEKTLFAMADILATQGKDKQCEFVLTSCILQYPRFVPAYNSLAELLMRQGRVNEAVHALSQGLQVRPDDPVLLNNLGMCLLVGKDYDRALEYFTKAAGRQPESRKYRTNMATALGLLGRHEEAASLLQQVLLENDASHNAQVLREAAVGASG